MLTSLTIKNFALIDSLSVRFSEGLHIITGETGAGKSILLGALGLVLGKRADLNSLRDKDEKCVVEAQFDIEKYRLKSFFDVNDLDYDSQTIIRREILPSGKSRAFVNDSPINLLELQKLGELLIDIHSQHQTLELSEEEFQFRILDAVSQNEKLINDYVKVLKEHNQNIKKLEVKERELSDLLKEQDYNTFLYNELEEARLQSDDQQELEEEYERLSNVELISESLLQVVQIAEEEQFGVLKNILEIKNILNKISGFSGHIRELFDRVDSTYIEVKDIFEEVNQQLQSIVNDPDRLSFVSNRLQTIYSLQKKHQTDSIAGLLKIQEELHDRVVSLETLEGDLEQLRESLELSDKKLKEIAEVIHDRRKTCIPVLLEKISHILNIIGMPNAKLKIELKKESSFHYNGMDTISFLLSANKGTDFGPLKKIASGGEMSRIMLAIKAVMSEYSNLPTIIFDEIDTGVSGEIADKMGDVMKRMSHSMQVISITHLPQIAAKGVRHFKVFKTSGESITSSGLKELSKEERVTELAQMLSGSVISESAINHAKALLN